MWHLIITLIHCYFWHVPWFVLWVSHFISLSLSFPSHFIDWKFLSIDQAKWAGCKVHIVPFRIVTTELLMQGSTRSKRCAHRQLTVPATVCNREYSESLCWTTAKLTHRIGASRKLNHSPCLNSCSFHSQFWQPLFSFIIQNIQWFWLFRLFFERIFFTILNHFNVKRKMSRNHFFLTSP